MKKSFYIFLAILILHLALSEDCSNFNGENSCQGSQTEYPSDWLNRKWQTPPRGDPLWKETFQDLNLFTGYIQIKYNNEQKTEATLTFVTMVNKDKIGESFNIAYYFGDKKTDQNQITFKKGDDMDIENGNL